MIRTLLATLASPLVAGALLFGVALAFLFSERGGRPARWALVALFAVAWALGTWPVADALIRPMERPWTAAQPDALATEVQPWIVVLAGSAIWDPELPPGAWLQGESHHRVAEGVRLQALLPESRLLLFDGVRPEQRDLRPEVYRIVAQQFGADPSRITYETGVSNTAAEARVAARHLNPDEPFFLVTSASHLTRAMYLFRREGLNPIPAPAQAYTWRRPEGERRRVGLRTFFPSVASYQKVDRAAHEYVGLLWARLQPASEPYDGIPNTSKAERPQ